MDRDVFRFALKATASSFVPDVAFNTEASHERTNPLLKSILYSRRFIIWYNVALAGILLCFTALHRGKSLIRSRRRRRGEQAAAGSTTEAVKEGRGRTISTSIRERDHGSTSSSASGTTVEGDAILPRAKSGVYAEEETPLLDHGRTHRKTPHSPLRVLKAWAMYQPRPLSVVNKTLPTNLTTFGILAFLGLNIFFLLYRAVPTVSTAFVTADRAGLLFVANLPLLYLLAAKNAPLKQLTGDSYEGLNILHRRQGELLCSLALWHAIGMLVVWYTILLPAGIDFWHLLSINLIWLGLGAFAAYELLYLTSLGSFRQRFYELFLASHILLQLAGLLFLWFHHAGARPYVGVALAGWAIDRAVFRLFVRTRTLRADLTVLEDGETVLVSADWQLPTAWRGGRWARVLARDIKHGWDPTEHVFLTVPALARTHALQAHPFTIASAAPARLQKEDTAAAAAAHAWLTLVIRARDGFSRDLLRYAQSHSSADVRLDGPYGSLHALEMLQDSQVAVVVAGGSGIAVAFPLVWHLLVDNADERRRVCLIWIVHDASHVDWIGYERLEELKRKGLRVVIPPPTRKAGRPAVTALLESAVEETLVPDQMSRVGVVVSGPDGMNRSVRNTCVELVRHGRNIDVAVEKFGW